MNHPNQSNFIWLETFYQPFRSDHYVIGSLDWRTFHRIHLFNHLADKAFHGTNFVQLSSMWSLVVAEKVTNSPISVLSIYTLRSPMFSIF